MIKAETYGPGFFFLLNRNTNNQITRIIPIATMKKFILKQISGSIIFLMSIQSDAKLS